VARVSFSGMRTKTRRRVDVALLAVGLAIAGGAAAVGAAAGDSERVTGLWAGAQIGTDGTARITEVIDYDFGVERRHGIFRDVPELPLDADVDVRSATAPDDVLLMPSPGNETRIRVGDPDRTISGRHRYTIEYALDTLIGQGRVAWDAVGTSWEVPIEDVEIHLVAPFRLDRLRCFQGERGSRRRCPVRELEPGHLVAHLDRLDEGRGVTVEADTTGPIDISLLPPAPSGAAEDPGAGLLLPFAVAALGALAGAAPTSFLVRRAGRDRVAVGGAAPAAWGGQDGSETHVRQDSDDLAALATVEFAPPEELSPPQGGVLLDESVSDDHKTAWLVQAAIDGYVDLVEDESGVTLWRRDRRDGPTAAILDQAFAGRDRLLLGSYDSSFANAWAAVGRELAGWQRASGLWDPAGDRRRTLVRVLGVVFGVVGLVATGVAAWPANEYGPAWLVLVAVAAVLVGAGWAALVRAWELRVRTARGSGLWLRVESFRRFLAQSEGHHAAEAAQRGVLREYTAWAVAVGEVGRWSRAVQHAGVPVTDTDGLRYAALAPSLSSSTSSTSTAPSSSGGGGGGVGGGGGGGGGGSW
jgi:Predicted membrane protein (DUF2207)